MRWGVRCAEIMIPLLIAISHIQTQSWKPFVVADNLVGARSLVFHEGSKSPAVFFDNRMIQFLTPECEAVSVKIPDGRLPLYVNEEGTTVLQHSDYFTTVNKSGVLGESDSQIVKPIFMANKGILMTNHGWGLTLQVNSVPVSVMGDSRFTCAGVNANLDQVAFVISETTNAKIRLFRYNNTVGEREALFVPSSDKPLNSATGFSCDTVPGLNDIAFLDDQHIAFFASLPPDSAVDEDSILDWRELTLQRSLRGMKDRIYLVVANVRTGLFTPYALLNSDGSGERRSAAFGRLMVSGNGLYLLCTDRLLRIPVADLEDRVKKHDGRKAQ
jgi:hypothetical protein